EDQELNKLIDKNSEVLYTQIVERIRMWILKGYLKEGDTLPSERELAQMFEVSRMPVSQAIKILEFLGVVQQVRGKGVCVKKIDLHHILNNIGFLMLDPQRGLYDLFEVREAIEIQAAKLAAQRRSKDDLDAMEDALLEMERNIVMKKDVKNASMRFHSALIAAAGNDVLIKVNDFLAELLRYSRQKSLNEVSRQDVALTYHKRIFQAVKEQNAEKASVAMQEHLQQLTTTLEDK
ncbi:MAG: FadR/GntR family transcriptional regulator, partial [Negativicutes bacterium]|nr:FadR/GntR family transcriptional regulator [Negativicutes bacterium]